MTTRAQRARPGPGGASRIWRVDGAGWITALPRPESPNQDERPPDAAVDLLLVHAISLPPGRFAGDAVPELFTNRLDPSAHPDFESLAGLRVSAHFFVRRSGRTLQFVACGRRAWHAGQSQFQGRSRCNDFSIGVELEGDADHPFTAAQYRALGRIARVLSRRYPLRWIAGHSDVAPGRKWDPGARFDWVRAQAATGLRRPFPSAAPAMPASNR